jgi:hypothetical protein
MNKVTVTFTGDVRTITIDFVHNVENETLDYNVTVDPPINDGDAMDLTTILADKFLGSLMVPDVEVVPDADVIPDETRSNI